MSNRASILIVDDEESLRFTFEFFLSEAGYDVTTAANFDEALSFLVSREFDLVIVDVILGGKTGLDLVREIRARWLNCRIVVITGDPTGELATDAQRCGVMGFVPKPVCKDRLLQITQEALDLR
ncbi:MAG: response regulator [Nitrospiraceae bacterium]|nr:response regulator [Nitrospiraceae bacterium]